MSCIDCDLIKRPIGFIVLEEDDDNFSFVKERIFFNDSIKD